MTEPKDKQDESKEAKEASRGEESGSALARYFKDFGVLRETRGEYWGIQAITFLDMMMFFAIGTIAVIMFTDDFGINDISAGYLYTYYSMGYTLMLATFAGAVTDWLGIRKSMIVINIGYMITRAGVLAAALMPGLAWRKTLLKVSFVAMSPFVATVQTVMQAGNKRFTTARSRGAGFNLWYVALNIGAAVAGVMIDLMRQVFEVDNAHIFSAGVVSAFLCLLITLTVIRNEEQLVGPDEIDDTATADTAADTAAAGAGQPAKKKNPLTIIREVARESAFWRFMALVGALAAVRAVFLYLHILLPKYWVRVIGPDALIGTLQAINPVLVIIGLILLIPILNRYNVYNMLIYGAMVSACSVFILAYPSYGQTTYIVSIAFLLVLTVGETFWSPRLQEYTAAIAPAGQEGTYLGFSMLPYAVAKMAASALSGHMLARYVPKGVGDQLRAGALSFWESPSALWIILGGAALIGPLIGRAFRGWFTRGARF
jgi:POT family proton-dependent oligopeptide transporter